LLFKTFASRTRGDAPSRGAVTRLFVDSILGWSQRHLRISKRELAQSGAVVAAPRASSDVKLNPHLHAVFAGGERGAIRS
jgi:hypothetical protein